MAYDALMTEDSKHKLAISTLNAKVNTERTVRINKYQTNIVFADSPTNSAM